MPTAARARGQTLEGNEGGVRTIVGYAPVRTLGDVCIQAELDYSEAVAPAEELRDALARRGVWFALLGAVVSLVLAQLIAAPVRTLAVSARALQAGDFGRRVPIAGPREIRELAAPSPGWPSISRR